MNEDDQTKGEKREAKERKRRKMKVSGRSVFLSRNIEQDRIARIKKERDEN
jgi:hypothetical protein